MTRTGLLTDRQSEVMDELLTGASNEQIAERLHMAVSTVKVHLAHVGEQLPWAKRHSRTALAVWWLHQRYAVLRGVAEAVAKAGPADREDRIADLHRVLTDRHIRPGQSL